LPPFCSLLTAVLRSLVWFYWIHLTLRYIIHVHCTLPISFSLILDTLDCLPCTFLPHAHLPTTLVYTTHVWTPYQFSADCTFCWDCHGSLTFPFHVASSAPLSFTFHSLYHYLCICSSQFHLHPSFLWTSPFFRSFIFIFSLFSAHISGCFVPVYIVRHTNSLQFTLRWTGLVGLAHQFYSPRLTRSFLVWTGHVLLHVHHSRHALHCLYCSYIPRFLLWFSCYHLEGLHFGHHAAYIATDHATVSTSLVRAVLPLLVRSTHALDSTTATAYTGSRCLLFSWTTVLYRSTRTRIRLHRFHLLGLLPFGTELRYRTSATDCLPAHWTSFY